MFEGLWHIKDILIGSHVNSYELTWKALHVMLFSNKKNYTQQIQSISVLYCVLFSVIQDKTVKHPAIQHLASVSAIPIPEIGKLNRLCSLQFVYIVRILLDC